MNTALVTKNGNGAGEIMESVIVKGDLGKLSPHERSQYYATVCQSIGLNPLTKPFEYITLNGKLTLYALRGCTDQLRALHKVSVVELTETERDGVCIVTAKVQNGEGRTDMAKGAVTIANLKGDMLANAIMKCETKAKRRATLSICGLGFLDETEIETSAEARPHKNAASNTLLKKEADALRAELLKEMYTKTTIDELKQWMVDRGDQMHAAFTEPYLDSIKREYLEYKAGLFAGEKQKIGNLGAAIQGLKSKPEIIKPIPDLVNDFPAFLSWLDDKCGFFTTEDALSTFWNDKIDPLIEPLFPPDASQAIAVYNRHMERISPPEDEQV